MIWVRLPLLATQPAYATNALPHLLMAIRRTVIRKGRLMCLICDRISSIHDGTNPYFVKELDTGFVVLGDNQHFEGYTIFLCKEHKTELFQLPRSYKLRFLEEMSIVAEAVSKAFEAEKMNYELLGNGNTHLHWHLFPRKTGDLGNYGSNGRGPVWWYPVEKMYSDDNRPSDAALREMRGKLLAELEALL